MEIIHQTHDDDVVDENVDDHAADENADDDVVDESVVLPIELHEIVQHEIVQELIDLLIVVQLIEGQQRVSDQLITQVHEIQILEMLIDEMIVQVLRQQELMMHDLKTNDQQMLESKTTVQMIDEILKMEIRRLRLMKIETVMEFQMLKTHILMDGIFLWKLQEEKTEEISLVWQSDLTTDIKLSIRSWHTKLSTRRSLIEKQH